MDFGEPANPTGPPPLPIPRPPASEAPRRRTRRACLTCQRKKLKCNGLQPCVTCVSHSTTCTYGHAPDRSRARARQHRESFYHDAPTNASAARTNERLPEVLGHSPSTISSSTLSRRGRAVSDSSATSVAAAPECSLAPVSAVQSHTHRGATTDQFQRLPITNILGASPELPMHTVGSNEEDHGLVTASGDGSHGSARKQTEDVDGDGDPEPTGPIRGHSGSSEGERLNEQSRLLNDGKGRLLYLGDSASLSFLDTIRRLVENTLGPSEFTRDPNRHKLVEGSITVVKKPTHVLPDREAAEFLIDSFFSNTVGILYILDREACVHEVAQIYANPLAVEQSRLSILNLLFAVGLQLTRSSTGHSFRESQILKRLDATPLDRAELFYLNATYLSDPIQGFEDRDITNIQALLLITVFMLTVAKRNAAWAYFGMAVRSAYALGLHRKETDLAFAPSEQRMRRSLWKSLYVMDGFISAMLGRPNSINSRDAPLTSFTSEEGDAAEAEEAIESDALTASIRASQLIGDILSFVYAERKISVKLANHLSLRFHSWKESLPAILRWQNISLPNDDPRTTLAQLRVNLSYFHGIILLTRPFLLHKIINVVLPSQRKSDGKDETSGASAEPFPPACVCSAVYSIDAVQSALLKRALPRRDPFVIYWLFCAALIVFSNGFANVCTDVDTERAMHTVLNLMQYLGEVDALARRYNQILTAFHAAISRKETATANDQALGPRTSSENIFNAFFGGTGGAGVAVGSQPLQASSAWLDNNRRNSRATNVPSLTSATSGVQAGAADWQPDLQEPSAQGQMPATAVATGTEGPSGETAPGSVTGISPPDYCLDFDAFFNSVGMGGVGSDSVVPSQNISGYGPDSWMPLYGTMDAG